MIRKIHVQKLLCEFLTKRRKIMESKIVDNKKKISVADFIKEYEAASTFVEKDNLVRDLIDTEYVPFVIKLNIAQKLVQKYNIEDNNIKTQTAMMYLAFTASVLRLYTRLDISETSTDIDYDRLQEYRLIDRLFELIGDDLQEYQKVFNMCEQDFNSNYLSVPSFVQRQLNKVLNHFGKNVDDFIKWLDTIDEAKIVKALKEIAK